MKRKSLACLLALAMVLTLAVPAMAADPIAYPIENGPTLTMWVPFNASAAKKISSFNENESFISMISPM